MNKLKRMFHRQQQTDTYWGEFLKRNDYPQHLIAGMLPKMERLPEDLKEALKRWDATGVLPDLEEEGFCLKELVEYAGLQEIAAFLMLDWLRREPEEAKVALAEPRTKIYVDEKCIDELIYAEETDSDK